MEQMRAELRDNPPVTGAYTPKKGDLCAAKFTDGEWYVCHLLVLNPALLDSACIL
jgi:hypothetical protein